MVVIWRRSSFHGQLCGKGSKRYSGRTQWNLTPNHRNIKRSWRHYYKNKCQYPINIQLSRLCVWCGFCYFCLTCITETLFPCLSHWTLRATHFSILVFWGLITIADGWVGTFVVLSYLVRKIWTNNPAPPTHTHTHPTVQGKHTTPSVTDSYFTFVLYHLFLDSKN